MSTADRSGEGLLDALGARAGLVCLAGAGGKKSTIYRCVSRFPGRVAVTSTVHTPPFPRRLAVARHVGTPESLKRLVASSAASRAVAYACPSDKRGRLGGVDPELVAAIHHDQGFELTLVKADGARSRRIKAPADREPVVPARFDTLIYLVSVRAVGAPLGDAVAHHPERVTALTGARADQPIEPVHLARLLASGEGGMKHAARARTFVPVINMVDDPALRKTARSAADHLLELAPEVERVVLTRMAGDDPLVEVVRR